MKIKDKTLVKDIDEIPFVILDLETTGLNAKLKDRIIEIGAIKMLNGKVIDELNSLINPLRPIALGAYKVNKIDNLMLEKAPIFEKFSTQLLDFIKDSVIVAYNAPFDVSFLEKELYLLNINANFYLSNSPIKQKIEYIQVPDYQLPLNINPNTTKLNYYVIDVLYLVRNIIPKIPMYKQSFIANYLGISHKPTHRALSDAYSTMEIFKVLIQLLKNLGFRKLNDLIDTNGIYRKISNKRIEKLNSAILNQQKIEIDYLNQYGFRKYKILPVNFDSERCTLEAIIDNYTEHFFIDRIFKIDEIN